MPIRLVLCLGMLTACAQDQVSPTTDSATSASPTNATTDRPSAEPSPSPSSEQAEPGTTVIAAGSDFGTILFDATGQAIYMFDLEATTEPRCYGACAAAWPPVLTDGAPLAGQRVKKSLLGTVPRTDGTIQVTYNGHPLYFYAHEDRHEVLCHDIFLNGGNWYAIQPDGNRAP